MRTSILFTISYLQCTSMVLSLIPVQRLLTNKKLIRNNNICKNSITKLYSTAIPETASAASSSDNESSHNKNGIHKEILNGKQFGDTKDKNTQVIDFGSVQNHSSKGEIALRKAKEVHISLSSSSSNKSVLVHSASSDERLMGINDMVVKEVGREIGDFANDKSQLVQECAAYLRATNPNNNLFSDNMDNTSYDKGKESEYKRLLDEAYIESGLVTEAFAKTFYLGTQLLPIQAQKAIWAIYVWCRRTDEIVDAERDEGSPEENNNAMLQDLSKWEYRLERLWEYGEVADVMDLPLLDTRMRYPTMSIQPFLDMIRGMLMDIPGLGQEKYDNFDELHLYCYRVAGTVGLMSLPVFGCAPSITEDIAKEPALSLGVAFQLTNILRDVGEDAQQRNRIYLPQDDMKKFGITQETITNGKITKEYKNFMKYQIARARNYYQKALTGVPMLSDIGKLPVQISLDCYSKILDKIEENDYDNLNKRAYLTKWEKLVEIPFSWYRTLEISKVLPLIGDDDGHKKIIYDLDELEKKLLGEL